MKNFIIGFGLIMVMMLTAFSLLALNTNTTKQNKLTVSTRSAVYQSVSAVADKTGSPPQSNTEMINLFSKFLAEQLNTDDKVDVKILGVDFSEGMLSVEVTQHYKNIGKDVSVKARETAFFDQTQPS